MKIRGHRECQECGAQWSYYETGSVECPDCGSLRSVGVEEERRLHTDQAATLELDSFRAAAGDGSVEAVADELKSHLRSYLRKRGFVSGGELRELDETYLAARELLHAVDVYVRSLDPSHEEQLYALALLGGADAGERPPASEVPASARDARGSAAAEAVDAYRRDLERWLEEHPDPEAKRTLGSLRDRVKQVEALQGDVPVESSDALVAAARDVGRYLRTGEQDALASAQERLVRLD